MSSARWYSFCYQQLHVYMSQQVKTCWCIAVILFNSWMAALPHSKSPLYKLSPSTYMPLMFSRCGHYCNISTSSTSGGQSTSASFWKIPPSRTWRLQVHCIMCGKTYTVVHPSDIQESYTKKWSARSRRIASNPVNVLWTIYSHHIWGRSVAFKQIRLVGPKWVGQ
jgi:hypothetical protein